MNALVAMRPKETIQALAICVGILALGVLVATPLCIRIASVDGCERMACEILVMNRPLSDVSYCEAWFDLYR